jgi:hypothetical protein
MDFFIFQNFIVNKMTVPGPVPIPIPTIDKSNWNRVSFINLSQKEEENDIPPIIIENIQNKLLIKNIEKRMFEIEQCYSNPQVLTIEGYNLIKNTNEQHWKSRIYNLFCDAKLPHYWILDIWKNPLNKPNEIPNIVYIQCITFRAKMYIKSVLTDFFLYQNTNINIYD